MKIIFDSYLLYRDLSSQPVDIDELPIYLTTEDPVDQAEISQSLAQDLMRGEGEGDSYDSREGKDLTISFLKQCYDRNDYKTPINIMRHFKPRLILKQEDVFDHTDPSVAWRAGSSHRLDYICTVGNSIGLHAALSGTDTNLEYRFELVPRPRKIFHGKYAQLGSDQSAALLYIGSKSNEDIYLFMAPIESLESNFVPCTPAGSCTGTTVMETCHSRILIVYLAYCLSLMKETTAVYCLNPYDVQMPPYPMSWSFTSAL